MAIHLRRPSPDAWRDQPGRPVRKHTCRGPCGPGAPPLFGLAPGGVCPAADVAAGAVRSYRTLSPLPASRDAEAPGRDRRFAFCGTFPKVTLAGRYPAPCSRGARTFLPPACAERRPSDRLARIDLRASVAEFKRRRVVSRFEIMLAPNAERRISDDDRIDGMALRQRSTGIHRAIK